MQHKSTRRRRRSIRLLEYDYASPGAYFVTLCTYQGELLFGKVVNEKMVLSEYGQIAHEEWLASPNIRREIELDAFVIMPNHIHGIVWIVELTDQAATTEHARTTNQVGEAGRIATTNQTRATDQVGTISHVEANSRLRAANHVGATGRSPHGPAPKSLGAFMAGYKSAVTKRINHTRSTPRAPVWQRNYWEHIVRTDRALNAIRQYIADNPARWTLDRYHPAPNGPAPHAVDLWRLLQENTQ